jgi:adenosylmethionine-8-amino-7-oxononanoate aminotransferase
MSRLAAYSTFGDFATRPTLDLAERLADMSPASGTRVFLTSGGSDGIDSAVKLARRFWAERGHPQRQIIVTRERAYHGMHMAGTSLAGIDANRHGHGDLDPLTARVAWDDPAALAECFDRIGSERVAAFICEPIIGAGGVYAPPAGYLTAVHEICRERGVLFIADEVICGFGRTGQMFASAGLDPDMVVTAKGLTSGYLPMGALLISGHVAAPFWTSPGVMWRHGYTYSGHAAAATAAMVNLDILEREHLVERVAQLAPVLARSLEPLHDVDAVLDVRAGVGLLAAVTLNVAADPSLGATVIAGLRERGVLCRMLADGSVQISPSFVITEADIALLGTALMESLQAAGARRSPGSHLRVSDIDLLPDTTRDERGHHERSHDAHSDDYYLEQRPPHHG